MFRDLLAKVLEVQFRYERVLAVATGSEAEDALRAEPFDLLIVDIDLPDRDGFSVAETASRLDRTPHVLGMSAYCDEFMVHRVMNSSMQGFIDKSEQSIETLRAAIETIRAGSYFFTEAVKRVQLALRDDPQAFPKLLSDRECRILTLMGSGYSNEAVAEEMGFSVTTALWHRKQVMKKLDLHSVRDLMLFAAKKGFLRRSGGQAIYPL